MWSARKNIFTPTIINSAANMAIPLPLHLANLSLLDYLIPSFIWHDPSELIDFELVDQPCRKRKRFASLCHYG